MNVSLWLVILLLLFTILFGTGSTVSPAATVGNPVVTVNPGVEINGNPGVALQAASGEGWTPEAGHLQAAEDAVAAAAPTYDPAPVLDGFRQYTGIVVDGQRKVRINSMCHEIDGWREHEIGVEDGGPCFWKATYNVDTGELEGLVINGEA